MQHVPIIVWIFLVGFFGSSGASNSTNSTTPTWTIRVEKKTQLTQSILAGSTRLPVQSSAGFAVGRQVVLNRGGGSEEYGVVATFGSIVLQAPTQFAHGANEAIEQITKPLNFCPDGGTHVGQVQSLKLTSTIPGALIYYTMDGTPASSSSIAYTPGSAISVSTSSTICSIAIAPGQSSGSQCRLFTVTSGTLSAQVAAPVFSQPGGVVQLGDKVQISTGTAGADIFWSAAANYTAPTACSWKSPVKGMVVVNFASKTTKQVTISAFAAMDGLLHSEIRSVTFQVQSANEEFSIGLGASRVKFKEQEV